MSSSVPTPRPISTAGSIRPSVMLTTRTPLGSSASSAARAFALPASSIRSPLVRMTRSAQAIWSSNTSSIGSSWSSEASAARCSARASWSCATRPSASAAPSTTATTPSTVTRLLIAGQWKACTSGLGSARPEVSMRMWSTLGERARMASRAGTKSSATVQQMQPLASSTMFSSGQVSMPQPLRISPSMPTSPNSLTITASRLPLAVSSTWRISVVFPEPRKPVTMVQGTRERLVEAAVMRRLHERGLGMRRSRKDFPREAARRESRLCLAVGHPADGHDRISGRSPGSRVAASSPPSRRGLQWLQARARRSQLRGQPRNRSARRAPRTAFLFIPPESGNRRSPPLKEPCRGLSQTGAAHPHCGAVFGRYSRGSRRFP